MKLLANFSRVIVGAYLIFSGFLKVVDPYGTALKLKEYFEVFALDLPGLSCWLIPCLSLSSDVSPQAMSLQSIERSSYFRLEKLY